MWYTLYKHVQIEAKQLPQEICEQDLTLLVVTLTNEWQLQLADIAELAATNIIVTKSIYIVRQCNACQTNLKALFFISEGNSDTSKFLIESA